RKEFKYPLGIFLYFLPKGCGYLPQKILGASTILVLVDNLLGWNSDEIAHGREIILTYMQNDILAIQIIGRLGDIPGICLPAIQYRRQFPDIYVAIMIEQ